jgi:hypothetical protein
MFVAIANLWMWLEMLLLLKRSGEAAVDAAVPSLKPAANEKR